MITNNQNIYPFSSNDITVVVDNSIRKFEANDWSNDNHKLLIFIPQAFTPVCQTELGAMNDWYDEFAKLGCELIAVCTDPAGMLLDWQRAELALNNPKYKTFSSYLLPNRLGLLDTGRSKRASVFITKDGEVVKQEHFNKVGRSFAELHRMLYGYTTDSYCSEGWISPGDGFLTPSS